MHKLILWLGARILLRRLQWGRKIASTMTEVVNLEAGGKSPPFSALDSEGKVGPP